MFDTSDDRELLHAFASTKDEGAFAEIVRRHQPMMLGVAGRVCGDPHDAMDAMQRALIAFARRAREIRVDEAGVGPWLHRATTLEALAVRRQRVKRSVREREAMEQQQLQTGGMPPEIAAELDEAINRLSPKDRSVIVLHFLENLTFQTIANKHGGTEAAWQKRGVRALEKLSGMLRRRGVVATGTALGTWLAASPAAEAAVPASAIKNMLNEALRQPLATGAVASASPALLLIMKLKATLALCFVSGAIISYGLSEQGAPVRAPGQAASADTSGPARIDRSRGNEPVFNLERIAAAIRQYDSPDEDSSSAESRLRALMFSVPEAYLASVHRLLEDVENPDHFDEITACFYARWAEIDPENAWLAALADETYPLPARRGVLLTWLNTDPEAALADLMEHRTDKDITILEEFLTGKAQHAPHDAATLVDRLAESWPQADRHLFPLVAKAWVQIDANAAGEWMASYWDRDARNLMLNQLSWRVAASNGYEGLKLADRIYDAKARRQARIGAIRWWGISSGGPAILPNVGDPAVDLSGGFPADWKADEIRSFALGTMANYSKYYPELVAVARDEEQRQAVYEGVIGGIGFSQPTLAARAVESVDKDFATTPEGNKSLSSFILRWSESDAAAAAEWLEKQPKNPKFDLMRDALQNRTGK